VKVAVTTPEAVVFVVDDDVSVREALESLVRSTGLDVYTFASAQDFLEYRRAEMPGCLVLDVQLPDLNGLDLQKRMAELNIEIPIVFISAHADIPTSVRAMKAGAVEFLTKPLDDEALSDAIQVAIQYDRAERHHRAEIRELDCRYRRLTPREREVMELVVSGLLNKQIAGDLRASEITIKVHRARVMGKMQADSLADLVRMSEKLSNGRASSNNRARSAHNVRHWRVQTRLQT
jgi:FixJ family two-component response regulator